MEMPGPSKGKAIVDVFREKFPLDEDNDQSILDQHVSRVWSDSPPLTPAGSMSPRTAANCRRKPPLHLPPQHLQHDIHPNSIDSRYGDGAYSSGHSSMRHSKSMPEHNMCKKLLSDKWPSMNTDSGISLFSADMIMTPKVNVSSRPSSRSITSENANTAYNLVEARRRLEDETKRFDFFCLIFFFFCKFIFFSVFRSKRYPQPYTQQLQQQPYSAPPLMPQQHPQEFSTCIITFCDEVLPYRIKIPSNRPTLKQFKELLPKKGNYR